MTNVYVVGAAMTPLGKHIDRSIKQLTAAAVNAALADAGCERRAIEAAWFSNTRQGIFEWQHGIRGQCALRAMGFEQIPIINTDNACASSSTGLNMAFAHIRAGLCEVALVVGAEKMNYPDKRDLMFRAFVGSIDRDLGEEQLRVAMRASEGLPIPVEAGASAASGERSFFMDVYSAAARAHMLRFGTTQRQMAAVAAKNHTNAQWNELSQYRTPMTIEEVLADKPIVWPFTRAMCAPMSDGAAALVVCGHSALPRFANLGTNARRAVRVIASQLASGVKRRPDDDEHHIGRIAAKKAFEQAGLDPRDLSVVEAHDATAFSEIRQIENLGLCEIGAGGYVGERGDTALGGRTPVNTSGGLLAKGHPIAATGAIQIVELVTQLRGEAGRRQVPNARLAAAENGGGFYDGEEAVTAVTILANDR